MSRITPDLIPHTDFHTGIWLQSVERPSWYYFKKKLNRNRITNADFINSVDGPLKELVLFLHQRGIKTTPSCSGHHISERNLEKIFDELEEDRSLIRNGGLNFKDVETGRLYFYKNKTYDLPWKKEDFIERLMIYQQKGVLGLRLGNRRKIKEHLLDLKIENVAVAEKDQVLFFLTGQNGETDIKVTWQEITKQVKSVF
jgi:hypothetical protein